MRERHGDKTSHKQRERFNRIEKRNRERGGTSSTKRDRNRARERKREKKERERETVAFVPRFGFYNFFMI